MHGDFNINRFIYLVLLFVMSIIFLIISPNIISILEGGILNYVTSHFKNSIKAILHVSTKLKQFH